MTRVYDYFKLLFQTYKIFFKATLLISVVAVALTKIEALAPVLGVQAGQRLVDQLSAQQPYGYFFCLWTLATVLSQVLPVVGTNFQGMLTDKLTGFIKLSLMRKSQQLNSLELFDDSDFFDDLEVLNEGASWRPVNLIVFGVAILREVVTISGMFWLLGKYNVWLALLLLGVLVPQTLVSYRIQQEAFETMVTRSKYARKLNYLSSLLLARDDAKEVRLFDMFSAVITRYLKLFNLSQKNVDQIRRKQMFLALVFLSMTVAVSAGGFWWFIGQVQQKLLGIGVLLMYISVIAYLVEGMTRLVEDSSLLYDSLLWVKKYQRFLEFKEKQTDGTLEFKGDFKKLKLEHVSFTYPFSKVEVLHDLNLEFNAGEKIAIVGENGSGKSTLVKLLLRYYDPSKGQILLDETPLSMYQCASYRKYLSAAFQDFSRFKLSVAANISALKKGPISKIKACLARVGLTTLEADLQQNLSKEFDHGTELSGGQWQKIALARCLYKDSSLCFLDEPTSALDARSEQQMYQEFLAADTGQTILFVTHRMSAVHLADRVLFLKNGTIAGFAPHAQLLRTDQTYRELYQLQKDAYK